MQTQSEVRSVKGEVRSAEWSAQTNTPKRSVFGNYRSANSEAAAQDSELNRNKASQSVVDESSDHLQNTIDLAVGRSFIYRLLALAYEDPTQESWVCLCDSGTTTALQSAWAVFQKRTGATGACMAFRPEAFESFHSAYLAVFGHAARGSCPLNEIEYGDIKADPLFQPHRLADLAAFYRAFGLEVTDDAGERHDHISLELEFMCVLAAKEAYALENQLDAEELAFCRDAQKKFLREHLGRWTPAFARRLAAATNDSTLAALASFTRALVESDCAHFEVKSGSEDLLLRPADEEADRMCDSCGIRNLPPGAEAEPSGT